MSPPMGRGAIKVCMGCPCPLSNLFICLRPGLLPLCACEYMLESTVWAFAHASVHVFTCVCVCVCARMCMRACACVLLVTCGGGTKKPQREVSTHPPFSHPILVSPRDRLVRSGKNRGRQRVASAQVLMVGSELLAQCQLCSQPCDLGHTSPLWVSVLV